MFTASLLRDDDSRMKPKEPGRSSIKFKIPQKSSCIMPESKLYVSVSADDDASSCNGSITDEPPTPSFPTLPTRKTLIRLAIAGKTPWALRQVDCPKRSTQTRCRGSKRRFRRSASR